MLKARIKRKRREMLHSLRPKIKTQLKKSTFSHIRLERRMVIKPKMKPSNIPKNNVCNVGRIVWAKIVGFPWWPALVVDGSLCDMPQHAPDSVWVFWFGDHNISEVNVRRTVGFQQCFVEKFVSNGSKKYRRAVSEASKEHAKTLRYNIENWEEETCIQWARNHFSIQDLQKEKSCVLSDGISDWVLGMLQAIAEKNKGKKGKKIDSSLMKRVFCHEENIKKVQTGLMKLEDICLACFVSNAEFVEHPLFVGSVCCTCVERLKDAMFAYTEDGKYIFCSICGTSGSPHLECWNVNCNRIYCMPCVTRLAGTIHTHSAWTCFLCADFPQSVNGFIKRREEWRNNIVKLFLPPSARDFSFVPSTIRRPLRVLSLFDGIGTGLLALDALGLKVEVFYASEVDVDAINISRFNFGNRITNVGDARYLNHEVLVKLGPIDLLLGGSPCNDLSFVNPARKGLFDATGTGVLVFEFYRILHILKTIQRNHYVFWMLENVLSMASQYKDTITRFLECHPALIDAQHFSAQVRARLFWGNIPGLGRTLLPQSSPNVDSVLLKNYNRIATREKLRTITTRSNCMKNGKDQLCPVLMNGKEDLLWATEVEDVFGFPQHYTDVGYLNVSRRRELLGKAWAVPVVVHILKALCEFFEVETRV